MLVKLSAPINEADISDKTALHVAVENNSLMVVEYLLNHDQTDIMLETSEDKNILQLALLGTHKSRLIRPILKRALMLNNEQQENFLKNISGESYKKYTDIHSIRAPGFVFNH